jgi:hypothetical protein
MPRARRAAVSLASLAITAIVVGVVARESAADLDNLVYTSRVDRIRIVVPRNWRASEQQSYPGFRLWMAPIKRPAGQAPTPAGQIQLTSEEFTRQLYCAWPVTCQRESLPSSKYACALRQKLESLRMRVGPVQAGPRENEEAGLPSVWFEYDDGKHFVRQAVAFSADRAFSLILSAPSAAARATHTRAFEQVLRTMRLLSAEETARIDPVDAALPIDALGPPGDAGPADATALVDAAVLDAGVTFESAPPPRENPIGPCTK